MQIKFGEQIVYLYLSTATVVCRQNILCHFHCPSSYTVQFGHLLADMPRCSPALNRGLKQRFCVTRTITLLWLASLNLQMLKTMTLSAISLLSEAF